MAFFFGIFPNSIETAAIKPTKTLLRSAAGGSLYRIIPANGDEKNSILFMELNGDAESLGRQRGLLLGDEIAEIIRDRYKCDYIQEILPWMKEVFKKFPRKYQREITAFQEALASQGHNFPIELVALHATQPIIDGRFPWGVCPWERPNGQTGSFSYAVWGDYAKGGATLVAHSPDWGETPKSWTQSRTIDSVNPTDGHRFAYLGVPGVIGMPGFNATGLSIAGTAGQLNVVGRMPMPINNIAIPGEFLTPFLLCREILQFYPAKNSVFERIEKALQGNPVDGFIIQATIPGKSVVWESGGSDSPDYPKMSRREAGAWDNGNILPVDWKGDMVLFQDQMLKTPLPFYVSVNFSESDGDPYSGIALISGSVVPWQRMQLGRGFFLPNNQERANQFNDWFAKLGTNFARRVPTIISREWDASMDNIVSVRPDKLGGFWVLGNGQYGEWIRDGNNWFHALISSGEEVCSGPLYDFGNGVTGWCQIDNNNTVEFVAWTHQYPSGADLRNDGMNICVVPKIKPWAQPDKLLHGGPHRRTLFLMRELGAPQGLLDIQSLYQIFQRAYLNVGAENDPFGVFIFSPEKREALFTASRYEGEEYIGGLNQKQVPIVMNTGDLGW